MAHLLTPRILILASVSWLIPFLVSFAFFGPGGAPWLPIPLFKSTMVVVFGTVGLLLLLRALRGVPVSRQAGLGVGFVFMVVNGLLDLAILLPVTGMEASAWLMDIGVRYLLMPAMGWSLGAAALQAKG